MTDLLQIIPSIVGGGFIGSLATHYLTTGRERREIRSEVLHKLSDTEQKRWAGLYKRDQFRDALRDLETAALIARLPRDLVLLYKLLAQTARNLSEADIEDDPTKHEAFAGGIDGKFATIVRDTAADMSRAIWAPFITRISLPRTIRRLEKRALDTETDTERTFLAAAADFSDYRWHEKAEPGKELPRPR